MSAYAQDFPTEEYNTIHVMMWKVAKHELEMLAYVLSESLTLHDALVDFGSRGVRYFVDERLALVTAPRYPLV